MKFNFNNNNIKNIFINNGDNISKVQKGYVGIDSKAKLFYESDENQDFLSNYTKLEYITNTNNSYINYNLNGTLKTYTSTFFYNSDKINNNIYIFGTGTNSKKFSSFIKPTKKINIRYASNSKDFSIITNSNEKLIITYNIKNNTSHNFTLEQLIKDTEGEEEWELVSENYTTNHNDSMTLPVSIFAGYDSNNSNIISTEGLSMYSFKIYDYSNNSILIADFIPCINNKNVVGMYDLIGKKFYSNAGIGNGFIAGPIVQ